VWRQTEIVSHLHHNNRPVQSLGNRPKDRFGVAMTEEPQMTQMNADRKNQFARICGDLRYLRFVLDEENHD
jgi:hypothetical protein